MKKSIVFILFVCYFKYCVDALSFPGPKVYVVTPASRPLDKDNGKFYYHNWIRRMDLNTNSTQIVTTTTVKPTIKTPDLIFAEFESNGSMKKSIRKLLEKEKIFPKSSTMTPIYVPDEDDTKATRVVNYGLPVKSEDHYEVKTSTEKTDVPYIQQDIYRNSLFDVNSPSTTTVKTLSAKPSTTTTTPVPFNVENVWHIIDNEKINQHSGNWHEVSTDGDEKEKKESNKENIESNNTKLNEDSEKQLVESQFETIDENFALPGFSTKSGSGAENESRAIRTEPIVRFPYVNLKPFQMKPLKKTSMNNLQNIKKNNNMLTSLDQLFDIKHPVRGEAQDILTLGSQIDRYNPAQPYLPQPAYGSKVSKQFNQVSPPKATANLVPPPPPPPKANEDFPVPISYESFPPYAPSASHASDFGSAPLSPPTPDTIGSQPLDTSDTADTSSDSDDGPTMDLGYRYKFPTGMTNSPMGMGYQYKKPSPPVPQFFPTIPPASKPFSGYSYDKPSMEMDNPTMVVADKPDLQGYHYNMPESDESNHDITPPNFGPHSSYGHASSHEHDVPSSHDHDSEYPDLILDKPNNSGDIKDHDMGMVAPPPPPPSDMTPDMYGSPPNDHGFPSDFPTDFKFHHDFDDHDHYHYHHTTTTTTEMPRVNRFSYYYLGKKLYYLPLYFSVYFIVYVGALIIKAVLRHKIVYPNSWRPNGTTATFFSKRSVDEYLSNDNLHEVTRKVTHALAAAAEKYTNGKKEI